MPTARQILKDIVFLRMAFDLSELATCARRKAGCLMVAENGEVLSHGFNGVGSGVEHCTDSPCPGAGLPSGTGLDKCEAIHAEQNALRFLKEHNRVHTVYVTASPCIFCVTQVGGTSAKRFVFGSEYPHPESKERWMRKEGREWILLPMTHRDPCN